MATWDTVKESLKKIKKKRKITTRAKAFRKRHDLAECSLEKHEKEMQQLVQDSYRNLMKMFQTESIIACKKCKKKNVAWSMAQTASADESSTVFCKCNDCGETWSFR